MVDARMSSCSPPELRGLRRRKEVTKALQGSDIGWAGHLTSGIWGDEGEMG